MTTYSIKYAEGDFTFFNNSNSKIYKDAYDVITRTESWVLMREDPGSGGFKFSSNLEHFNKIRDILSGSHSGSSYSHMMRHMQFIANHGWDKYIDEVIATKN